MFIVGEMRYTTDSAIAGYADQLSATITHYDLGGPDQIDIDDLEDLAAYCSRITDSGL